MKKIISPSFKKLSPTSIISSRIKQANRSEDTRQEIILRKALYKRGLRYRKNVQNLPGKPDIVFLGARVVIFCDGDFWHGRNWNTLKRKLVKGKNAQYWIGKIHSNLQRDRLTTKKLEDAGWQVIRIWEIDIFKNCEMIADNICNIVQSRMHS